MSSDQWAGLRRELGRIGFVEEGRLGDQTLPCWVHGSVRLIVGPPDVGKLRMTVLDGQISAAGTGWTTTFDARCPAEIVAAACAAAAHLAEPALLRNLIGRSSARGTALEPYPTRQRVAFSQHTTTGDLRERRVMTAKNNRICVFCGSGDGNSKSYREAAWAVGRELANRDMTLVYGAGPTGMMGTVAEATWANGGDVIGVIPRLLAEREKGRSSRIDLRLVDDMNERKALMAELSDGFIVLPGGLGTYDELFEMLTWSQLRFHDKPTVVVNVDGHFDLLVQLLDQAVKTGFVRPEHRSLATVTTDVVEAVDVVVGASTPTLDRVPVAS